LVLIGKIKRMIVRSVIKSTVRNTVGQFSGKSWTSLYYILKSGSDWYKREINLAGGYFKLWYSDDSGVTWEMLFILDLTEDSVIIDLPHLYRHSIVDGAYNVDWFNGGIWENLYSTGTYRTQIPTDLTATLITGGVKLNWTNNVTTWDGTEIWESINGGAYTLKGESTTARFVSLNIVANKVDYKIRTYKGTRYTDFSSIVNGFDYDSDAKAYIDASFISNNAHRTALDTFVKYLKTNNLWAKIYCAYWTQGDFNTLSALDYVPFNLKNPLVNKVSFVGQTTPIDKTGIKWTGGSTGNYGDTGYTYAAANRTNKHLCVYAGELPATSGDIGTKTDVNNALDGIFMNIAGSVYIYLNDRNNKLVTYDATNKVVIGSRRSATNISLYGDGSPILNNIASNYANADSGSTEIIGRCNNNGTTSLGYYYSFGEGLTDTEAALYTTGIKALKTAWDAATFTDEITNLLYDIIPLSYQSSNLHVESQRGDMVFASKTGNLMWSNDNGETFVDIAFIDAKLIVMSHIFANGNVLFATNKNELWLGKNSLTTITQKTLKDTNGSDYVFHIPVDAAYPGIYFIRSQIDQPVTINGQEMLCWGSYLLAAAGFYQAKGANPNNVYYSYDNGETVKVAYKFGRNASYKDDGTQFGSAVSGNLLGDATNPFFCDHIHNVIYDSYADCFYVLTGEDTLTTYWIRLTYNPLNDTWANEIVIGNTERALTNGYRYRVSGFYSTSTKFRLLSDTYGDAPNFGVWEVLKTDIKDPSKMSKIYVGDTTLFPSLVYADKIISGHLNNNVGVSISKDGGVNWDKYVSLPYTALTTPRINLIGNPDKYGRHIVTPYIYLTESWYAKQSYWMNFK
jgi:hypothetical protein